MRQEAKLLPQPPADAQAHFLGIKVRRDRGRAGAVEGQGPKMSFPKYKPSRLATLPPTLDPAEYDISPETRKAQAERLAVRSRLKREYQLQYNDPSRRVLIVSGGRQGGSSGGPLRLGSLTRRGGLAAGRPPFPAPVLDIGPRPSPESRPTH